MAGAFVALAGAEGFLPDSEGAREATEGTVLAVRITRAAQGGKGPRLSARGANDGTDPPGAGPPALLRRGPNAVERLAALHPGAELWVDGPGLAAELRQFSPSIGPCFDDAVESAIAALYESTVELPGGARMHIHPTPALVAIDIDLAAASAELIDVGKQLPDAGGAGSGGRRGQDARQDDIARLLVEHGRRAGVVVRLKGGDPFVFGRGGEEVEALVRAGLAFEVVPGVTSAFAAPAVAGIPVTHRGVASSVTVVTGRVGAAGSAGADGAGAPDWEALARAGGTLVILMGMSTRAAIADALVAGGRAPDTPVAVIARATTASQRVVHTTLAGLAGVELDSPAVIVVGPVVALAPDSP
jgi:uroporphyrin-III C-methyltransferase